MGFSTVMASTIVFYVALVLVGALAGAALTALTGISRGVDAGLRILRGDAIRIEGVSYSLSLDEVWVNLSNVGESIIYDYKDFDVIVYYRNLTGEEVIFYARLRGGYSDYPAYRPPGWYVYGVYDASGGFHAYTSSRPVYWLPGTTLEIRIVLPDEPEPLSTISIAIATPGGGRVVTALTWG